jgi:phospholipid/cholesterol/gamma-HCH transport system ATP-binding protein
MATEYFPQHFPAMTDVEPTPTPPPPAALESKEPREFGEIVLQIEHLDMQFSGRPVLRDINITVRRGETLAVIGESGCGKTVLLKNMIGLLLPTSGRVSFDGRDLSRLSQAELAKQRTRYGFVFQQAALFDSISVGENIAFPLRQHTSTNDENIRKRIQTLLAEVGLPNDVANKKPAELSGGMKKRVGFARAMAMDPELILYDEPTTGLDPIMSDVIGQLIVATRSNHDITSVVVTHDMKLAAQVADRIVMLYPISRLKDDESQILFEGTPFEIETSNDSRVTQFVRGEAGERLMEMRKSSIETIDSENDPSREDSKNDDSIDLGGDDYQVEEYESDDEEYSDEPSNDESPLSEDRPDDTGGKLW